MKTSLLVCLNISLVWTSSVYNKFTSLFSILNFAFVQFSINLNAFSQWECMNFGFYAITFIMQCLNLLRTSNITSWTALSPRFSVTIPPPGSVPWCIATPCRKSDSPYSQGKVAWPIMVGLKNWHVYIFSVVAGEMPRAGLMSNRLRLHRLNHNSFFVLSTERWKMKRVNIRDF